MNFHIRYNFTLADENGSLSDQKDPETFLYFVKIGRHPTADLTSDGKFFVVIVNTFECVTAPEDTEYLSFTLKTSSTEILFGSGRISCK